MKKGKPVYYIFLLLCCISSSVYGQSVTSCSPDTANRATTVSVTISGVGLGFTSVSPTSVELVPSGGGTAITTTSISATSDNTANISLTIPLSAATGDYDIKVLPNMSSYSLSRFYISAFLPSISECVPNVSPPGNTLDVTISGVGMDFMSVSPTSVQLTPVAGGATISSSTVTAITSSKVTSTITIPGGATLGDYDVQILPNMPAPSPSVFYVSSVAPGTTGTITGHIFLDENSNCIQEGAEADFSGCVVAIYPDSFYILTDPSGNYSIDMVPGSYDVDAFPHVHDAKLCPSGTIPVMIAAPGSVDSGNDFVIDVAHVTDAVINCWLAPMRPGFYQTHTINVANVGFLPITGEVKFVLDPLLTYVSSSPTGTFSGGTVSWTISPPITPGTMRTYHVTTYVPIGTTVGTIVHCESMVIPVGGDITPADDTSSCEDPIVASCDPNDKMVWNQDMIPADPFLDLNDSILYYRIRFQNTGTASAVNIFIRDTLDPYLDASTLETVGASHSPFSYSLNGTGNLEWRFPGIDLPDSNSNEPASHGFVAYRVKIKPGFSLGAFIRNKASIYFDFNDPVVTNETFSSILVTTGCPGVPDPIRVYPNPATEVLHIETSCASTGEIRFALLNQVGAMVSEKYGECNGVLTQTDLPLEGLSPGVYLLETTTGQSRYVKKIVILR